MKKSLIFLSCIWMIFGASFGASLNNASTKEPSVQDQPLMEEVYRILIPNEAGGTIEVSTNKGATWEEVGHVIAPTWNVNDQGYTASKWIDDGSVAAVAVNAIHIKTDYNDKEDKGIIFNILPIESYKAKQWTSTEATIYTDINAGGSIFGGGYSPFVGSTVYTMEAGSAPIAINTGYVPKYSDKIVIIVERPTRYPKEIVFENRFGGLIYIEYLNGEKRYIGQVLKPVEGVGRFLGTEYADVGRIRANHAGVICISCSSLGEIGGFQIIPAGHGMSKEMIRARTMTQWMVIGPVSAFDPAFEGVAPFFKFFIQPRYNEDDIDQPDWQKKLLERFLVEVQTRDKPEWQPMHEYHMSLKRSLPKWAETAMEGVTKIRILFPIYH